jgi:transketolase
MEDFSRAASRRALGIGRIIYLYDDNCISIEGSTDLAYSEDTRAGRGSWLARAVH